MADSTIITSQYVQIDQTPASIGDRVLARIIDMLIISIYYAAAFVVFGVYMNLIGANGEGVTIIVSILLFIPALFYSLLWETFNQGQSIGKRILGIRVVMKDGSRPTFSAYLLRWLLLAVDFYISYIGLVCIALNKDNRRFGDLAAGTLVIKEKDYRRINVTLDEFKHLSYDYHPVFPQAENLSLEQANLIVETLSMTNSERPQRIHELAVQVRNFLHIQNAVPDEALLQTLTRDYQYYALEEI